MAIHTHDEDTTYLVMEKVEYMFLKEHPQAMEEYEQLIQGFWGKYNEHLLRYVAQLGK